MPTTAPTTTCNRCKDQGIINGWRFYSGGEFCPSCRIGEVKRAEWMMSEVQLLASIDRYTAICREQARAGRRARRAARAAEVTR